MTKLADVNVDDIAGAIRLGCRTMCQVFNRRDHDIPFFESCVRPAVRLRFHPLFSEAHVPGRHLNALLTAQATLGVEVSDECLAKQTGAAFYAYRGAVPLPLNRATPTGALHNFLPHNIREGFHALYALAKYRDSAPARALAEASIATIGRLWTPGAGWNREHLERHLGLHVGEWDGPFITGLARAMGPLVKYYQATGYEPALELAVSLKEKAVREYFTAGGAYDPQTFGTHTHSTTCVLSSLAQLADLTADAPLMRRVKEFYDAGLAALRDPLGWVLENSRPDAHPDRGEANNTGDLLEIALILGSWGFVEYYGEAERILRGHLLPSQLRDISFIAAPAPAGEETDGTRDVARRLRGAFGFPAPYGHEPLGADTVGFNMDIVGGAVASLCAAYRHIAPRDPDGHRVNLLFDHETDDIKVESPYTHGHLRVTVKRPAPLFVRIPAWANGATIRIPGIDSSLPITKGYLVVAQPPVNQALSFDFALPAAEIVLVHRTRHIRVRMTGDQVRAMDNFGADLTFFDPIA